MAYNENDNNDVPRCIDHVHLPADIGYANRHDEHQEEPGNVIPAGQGDRPNLREGIEHEL